MKDLLLGFVADRAGVVEDQAGVCSRSRPGGSPGDERAHDFFGVMDIHLAAEGLDVKSFLLFAGHWLKYSAMFMRVFADHRRTIARLHAPDLKVNGSLRTLEMFLISWSARSWLSTGCCAANSPRRSRTVCIPSVFAARISLIGRSPTTRIWSGGIDSITLYLAESRLFCYPLGAVRVVDFSIAGSWSRPSAATFACCVSTSPNVVIKIRRPFLFRK